MLKFVTSFSFLYLLTIGSLLLYGVVYYRDFTRSGYQRRRFPYIFLLISAACFAFLYFNIHASLKLKTFSNLDHHFIRHDGFEVAQGIELGRSDTVNYQSNSFNRFMLSKKMDQLIVTSSYSEEPFYIASGGTYKLSSTSYPAVHHSISFHCDSMEVVIRAVADSNFELQVNNAIISRTGKMINKGASAWNLFKDDIFFINTSAYTNDNLGNSLRCILLLRDDVSPKGSSHSKEGAGSLKYFLSGRLFRYVDAIKYDEKDLRLTNLVFTNPITDKSTIAWGIGFLDNNKNQFRVKYLGADSFALANLYPVAYPLSEEKRDDWTQHPVKKFLVSDPEDMVNMSSVFNEGFLFAALKGDHTIDFSPVLLTYQKSGGDDPLVLKARFMDHPKLDIWPVNNILKLPARSSHFSWVFSIQNSFNWNFGTRIFSSGIWQWLLFGTLIFFFVMIFFSSWLQPASTLSWIWQLLSSVTMVLLTTRFFLYWRYKSFPPYEGMDLPSQQQLDSLWNFGIIILAGVLLAIIFGFGLLRYLYAFIGKRSASLLNRPFHQKVSNSDYLDAEKISGAIDTIGFVKKGGVKTIFFLSWLLVLLAGGGFAAFNHFDPAVSRHLSIGLMLVYFIYIFISYKHSPLVASAEKSWWGIRTGQPLDIIMNNPVKVLLSISLLALFIFVDIGFAIVYLNFLLFNEAFLCINYAVAGLSAGSRKNARLFGLLGFLYIMIFVINLVYGPYIFKFLLDLPQLLYILGYILFALTIAYTLLRLFVAWPARKKMLAGIVSTLLIFGIAFLFFPKERILEKAAITRYRIDVMTMPVDKAIQLAYEEGKTYEPVIRAAQNQWFINTFIYEKNNPGVNSPGFHLLPHAPQNKGAKYNAQATDLVASRFFIAEHGKWSVLFYVLLLLLPTTLLASFYKLYPDFTNRINTNYPTITTGFSLLNYLLITALLVILAATGRYIFFGQDLPFGSILSKQSVLFPSILIIATVLLFKNIPLEHYPNRKKLIPGAIVFVGLGLLLFLVKPVYNKDKEFAVTDIARDMDSFIQLRLQPVFDYFDSSGATKRLTVMSKDRLFTDSVRKLIASGYMTDAGKFFAKEIESYTQAGFSRHLDQGRMLYLDLNSGRPQLAVNDNYFHIDPPPHLQQFWTGNIFGDSTNYNIALWNAADGSVISKRMSSYTTEPAFMLNNDIQLVFRRSYGDNLYGQLCLVNKAGSALQLRSENTVKTLRNNDTLNLLNPDRFVIADSVTGRDKILVIQPDAFMKNYYVNGSRYYVYPMGSRFTWARNFAESVSSEYTTKAQNRKNAFVSLNVEMMDSLSARIQKTIGTDTAYKKGAEYGICIADGNGRLIAMTDYIKGMIRPDPNDKAGFNKLVLGENGFISQSLLRKQIGNINLLRMNPGPGSTLKPIVFTAIASQLNLDWDALSSEGFSTPQQYYGGEKVAEYDFEKNNGRISRVVDYLKYSDNYYHSNVLLLGSYSKQNIQDILTKYFVTVKPETHPGNDQVHWPYFSYKEKQYWLPGFASWPGYMDSKADFGSDSSSVSIGLFTNYGIYTRTAGQHFDKFLSGYDSSLFYNAYKKSGFILPEYPLFDQHGGHIDHRIPYDVFMSSFRGHVKGSSQVMIPPVKMLDAFGKLVSQNRDYGLTLNPYANGYVFRPFYTDSSVAYNNYLSIIRENVFTGMREALYHGTAARLGAFLKDGAPYFYYAKTGTTGDNEETSKSKLFAIIISSKDITDPDFNFRKNKFYTIYFTSQNGAAKQNEEFQYEIIRYILQSPAFTKYMKGTD